MGFACLRVGQLAGDCITIPMMREITAETAADYLRETGRAPSNAAIVARELSGGVSNIVLRVEVEGERPYVLKQSRERLRTAMEWYSRLDRIWTERAALEVLAQVLPDGMVPRVLWEDRANYLFAMDHAPEGAVTWKHELMAGRADLERARLVGGALGAIHAGAAAHPSLDGIFADTSLFDSLRTDPYYRTVARVRPELAEPIGALVESMALAPCPTLVLGDFSPKNILVHDGGIVLLDFECAHRGDPAFDLGFLFSHLILKAFRGRRLFGDGANYLDVIERAWAAYVERSGIDPGGAQARRGVRHAAGCLFARLDGKSPVEYLGDLDAAGVRGLALALLREGLAPSELVGRLRVVLETGVVPT